MDLTGYKLVFEDDFNGDALDTSVWQYRADGARRMGFNSGEQVRTAGGKLIMRSEYKTGRFGEGWYSGMISLRKAYLRGYFEVRCICSRCIPGGFWSAFWLQAGHPYEAEYSRGGKGGAEIDIFETFCGDDGKPMLQTNLHCAGMKNTAHPDGFDSLALSSECVADACDKMHVYGCEWTEDEYRFYRDGVMYARTSFGDGVSEVAQEVILSLELPDTTSLDRKNVSEFAIDYIRIYQK